MNINDHYRRRFRGTSEAVTGISGAYGYTAYSDNITSMFTGADKNNTTPESTSRPGHALTCRNGVP